MRINLPINFNALLDPIVQRLQDILGENLTNVADEYRPNVTIYSAYIIVPQSALSPRLNNAVRLLCKTFSSSSHHVLNIEVRNISYTTLFLAGGSETFHGFCLVCTAPLDESVLKLLADIEFADAELAALHKRFNPPALSGSDKPRCDRQANS